MRALRRRLPDDHVTTGHRSPDDRVCLRKVSRRHALCAGSHGSFEMFQLRSAVPVHEAQSTWWCRRCEDARSAAGAAHLQCYVVVPGQQRVTLHTHSHSTGPRYACATSQMRDTVSRVGRAGWSSLTRGNEFPHGTHLDAPKPQRWHLRGDPDGVVQVPRLDQVKAAQLFLRLGERTIGDGHLAVAKP